jgi:hypothetical protein
LLHYSSLLLIILSIGQSWKKLLALSNEELNIDAEFTREGIKALLHIFSETVDAANSCDTEFVWN